MTHFEMLIKFAEAYTILMKLMVKNAEYARVKAYYSLKKISEDETTQLNNEICYDAILTDEDYASIEKVFMYILQALNEEPYDADNVQKLLESFNQVLSSFKITKREIPATLQQLYISVLDKLVITDENRLKVENFKNMIYNNYKTK